LKKPHGCGAQRPLGSGAVFDLFPGSPSGARRAIIFGGEQQMLAIARA